jgi:hypothetical protein
LFSDQLETIVNHFFINLPFAFYKGEPSAKNLINSVYILGADVSPSN